MVPGEQEGRADELVALQGFLKLCPEGRKLVAPKHRLYQIDLSSLLACIVLHEESVLGGPLQGCLALRVSL